MTYREGHDETPVDAPASDTDSVPVTPKASDSSDVDADEIDVAFIVFRTRSGSVFPAHTQMDRFGVATKRDVTPNEMYRMCLDLADQLSAVRVVGEVLKGVRAMLDAQTQQNVSRKPAEGGVPE
jgi:hypothetical protein